MEEPGEAERGLLRADDDEGLGGERDGAGGLLRVLESATCRSPSTVKLFSVSVALGGGMNSAIAYSKLSLVIVITSLSRGKVVGEKGGIGRNG